MPHVSAIGVKCFSFMNIYVKIKNKTFVFKGKRYMYLTGTIERIIFRNEANGFTVFEVTDESGDEITAVGGLQPLNAGEYIELSGEWVDHRTYGRQFKADTAKVVTPATDGALVNYLSSGLIKGVGAFIAKSIVDRFGSDALTVIETDPMRLKEIPGIGVHKARMIHESYMHQRSTRDVFMGLQAIGMTINQSTKAYKLYGELCLQRIRENPYRLIDDIENIGFKTADKIARGAGIERDSKFRIQAGIKYSLSWARQEGHTYLPLDALINTAKTVLEIDDAPIEAEISELVALSQLICININDQDALFLPSMYYQEGSCAKRLMELANTPEERSGIDIELEISMLEKQLNISLAPMQRQAVITALTKGVMVITGGPGTGKTTILKFIISIMDRLSLDYELCAPTGRAAKRMGEAAGVEARTIHRLLEYGYGQNSFSKNEENPVYADMIIVDEMSMVDVPLMNSLLKATVSGTRLVMVGDADQLPPVGAGNVLHDIIESGLIPVIRLEEIFRQSGRSMIVHNAHCINRGQSPDICSDSEDFHFHTMYSYEEALEYIKRLFAKGSSISDPLKDVQVLAPMKKGLVGVNNINACLQAELNPRSEYKAEYQNGDTLFREGDKVMQVKNNYNIEWVIANNSRVSETGTGVFNGDMGTIMRIDHKNQCIEVLFDDERCASYSQQQLEELTLAYCISIHKSQGSEFPIVVLPLFSGPPMLMTRNLLYTAVTRARNQVFIIGKGECVMNMVKNAHVRRRYSGLAQFMRELSQYAEL